MMDKMKAHVGVCYIDEADKVVAAAIPRGEVADGSWQVVLFGDKPVDVDTGILADAACVVMNDLVTRAVHNCLVCGGDMRTETRGHMAVESSDGEHSVFLPRSVAYHEQPQCVAWLRAETRLKCVTADGVGSIGRAT